MNIKKNRISVLDIASLFANIDKLSPRCKIINRFVSAIKRGLSMFCIVIVAYQTSAGFNKYLSKEKRFFLF